MKHKFSFLLFVLFSLASFAQGPNAPVEMADAFRSNGKIFVVVAVMLTIFAGIILYLVRLDRKLSKIEKESVHHQ